MDNNKFHEAIYLWFKSMKVSIESIRLEIASLNKEAKIKKELCEVYEEMIKEQYYLMKEEFPEELRQDIYYIIYNNGV